MITYPIAFSQWLEKSPVSEMMTWQGAAQSQFANANALLAVVQTYAPKVSLWVLGTHRSKSIELPVYKLHDPDSSNGIYFRHNFHDICCTVHCETHDIIPTGDDRADIMRELLGHDTGYFEGFDRAHAPKYGPYDGDKRQFSFVLNPDGFGLLAKIARLVFCGAPAEKPITMGIIGLLNKWAKTPELVTPREHAFIEAALEAEQNAIAAGHGLLAGSAEMYESRGVLLPAKEPLHLNFKPSGDASR